MFQDGMQYFDWVYVLSPILAILLLLSLILVMVACYLKVRVFVVILTVFLFSLVFGSLAIQYGDIPFTPYFQIFFMVIQTIFFVLTAVESFTK